MDLLRVISVHSSNSLLQFTGEFLYFDGFSDSLSMSEVTLVVSLNFSAV